MIALYWRMDDSSLADVSDDPSKSTEASMSDAGSALSFSWKGWHILGAAAVAFAIVSIGIPFSRPVLPPPTPADPTSTPAATVQRPIGLEDPLRAPRWFRTKESGWASDGSKTVTFALEAEDEVGVWMKRVRQTLAVRCLGREIEAYVVTDSASSIESRSDRHTVRVAFDDGSFSNEQWLDSSNHRELFAVDGQTFVHRVATSARMRFGYTPFNASPVVAHFDVRGFAAPLREITTTCQQPVRHATARVSRR